MWPIRTPTTPLAPSCGGLGVISAPSTALAGLVDALGEFGQLLVLHEAACPTPIRRRVGAGWTKNTELHATTPSGSMPALSSFA